MSSSASDTFPSDQDWVDILSPPDPVSPESSANSFDANEQRWGFLEPENGDGVLDFHRDHKEYNIINDSITGNLTAIPGDDGHLFCFKAREIKEVQTSRWAISLYTPGDDGRSHRLCDGERVGLDNRAYRFHDTINSKPVIEGAFIKYDTIPGCQIFRGKFGSVQKVSLRTDRHFQYALKIVSVRERPTLLNVPKPPPTHEISVLKALDHPNICRLVDAFSTKSREIHIVIEYAELYNLGQRLESPDHFITHARPLSWEAFSRSTIFQLCTATNYVHSQGIVHRDIKPDNILFTSMSPLTLKLADFGLAVREASRPRVPCGTYSHVAPEVMTGKGYDERVDSYGIGVVVLDILLLMYECKNPFWDWKAKLKWPNPTAADIANLARIRNQIFESNINLQNADAQALELAKGLLKGNPRDRTTVDASLENPWVQETYDQHEENDGTQIPTESVMEEESPVPPPETPPTPHREVSPIPTPPVMIPSPQPVGPAEEEILPVPHIMASVEETERRVVLPRRSERISKHARNNARPYWLYCSGLEEGQKRD